MTEETITLTRSEFVALSEKAAAEALAAVGAELRAATLIREGILGDYLTPDDAAELRAELGL